jgi:hypothetical protein
MVARGDPVLNYPGIPAGRRGVTALWGRVSPEGPSCLRGTSARPPEGAGRGGSFVSSREGPGHSEAPVRTGDSSSGSPEPTLLFLYHEVLEKKISLIQGVVRAKRPSRLPVVLTKEEVKRLLSCLRGTPWLMGMLLYGAGLRLMECCRLRVKDIDFSRNQIVVRAGKGNKDRYTMLPAAVKETLLKRLQAVKRRYEEDLRKGLVVWPCPMPLSGNTQTQARSGDGNGSSQPQAPLSTGPREKGAVTTSTNRFHRRLLKRRGSKRRLLSSTFALFPCYAAGARACSDTARSGRDNFEKASC